MRAVVQRVNYGQVTIDGKTVAKIGKGAVILLGIGPQDDAVKTALLAKKISMLRIFEDDQEKMNLSLLDIAGEAIVVSQFTLYADTRKGNRPSFTDAAKPELASPLVDQFVEELRKLGVPTQTGVFGAHMLVALENDGPVTICLDL
ncbi:MAG: D-aminoacyl-tRNA deacylase [Anaerolineaceae bacterium]